MVFIAAGGKRNPMTCYTFAIPLTVEGISLACYLVLPLGAFASPRGFHFLNTVPSCTMVGLLISEMLQTPAGKGTYYLF